VALFGIGNGNPPLFPVPEIVPDLLVAVTDDEDKLVDAAFFDLGKQMLDERSVGNGKHHFRPVAGERAHALAFAGR